MKSPAEIAQHLARQWQRADWRERHLLQAHEAWPLKLGIGKPDARTFSESGAALKAHLQQWQAVADGGPGQVQWSSHSFREGSAPLRLPVHWVLSKPGECMRAIARFAGPDGAATLADHEALAAVLAGVDARFYRLLLRRLALWRGTPPAQVVAATRMALHLAPGCAQGKPLRALAVDGNDSKFFERHGPLIAALLDERFDGEVRRQGLANFLGASHDDDHWLLVVPLAPGLLPFARQRVRASELRSTSLPAAHILLIENERCLHQLPMPLPDTIAVLGAGNNLGWLDAPWLRERATAFSVAYWGDMDTWGLQLLATARRNLPHIHALLMDVPSYDAHRHLAVPEPMHAPPPLPHALASAQAALDAHLRMQASGRLEQEFLPPARVEEALRRWLHRN